MRSIYYRQRLPSRMLLQGSTLLAQRLKIMEMAGLIRRIRNELQLTDAGVMALRSMYGGRKPRMIDIKDGAMFAPRDRKKEFIVESSLAREIAREVSIGT